MIVYNSGTYALGFIWGIHGSTIPHGMVYAICSTCLMFLVRVLRVTLSDELAEPYPVFQNVVDVPSWTIVGVVLGVLLTFRTRVSYSRFWEGCTLVQQMRAEWYDAISTLIAFSHSAVLAKPTDQAIIDKVEEFQYTLTRLVSLMHGAALRQIGGDVQEFDVLDVMGLDSNTLEYLRHCEQIEANRVEVILHWIQELVTENHRVGVLAVPPPILSRVYQTLSRGMVNLHNARKLADVPFPFPLAQITGVLLLLHSILHPIYVGAFVDNYVWGAVYTFIPISMMWSITLVAAQLEQPFGEDHNDLPLSLCQFDMNQSLLMLLDERVQRLPTLKKSAGRSVHQLEACFGDKASRTDFLEHNNTKKRASTRNEPSRMAVFHLRQSQARSGSDAAESLAQFAAVESDGPGGPNAPGGSGSSGNSPIPLDAVNVSIGTIGASLGRSNTWNFGDEAGDDDSSFHVKKRPMRRITLPANKRSDAPEVLRLPPESQDDPQHLVAAEPSRITVNAGARRPFDPEQAATSGALASREASREGSGHWDIKLSADMSRLPVSDGDAGHVLHEATQ